MHNSKSNDLGNKVRVISTGSIMPGKVGKELFKKLSIVSQMPALGDDFAPCTTMGRYWLL